MAWQKAGAAAAPRRDNSGSFKTNSKRENPKQPHFKGGMTANGRDYWLSVWIKDRNLGATEIERVEAFVQWLGRKEVAFSLAVEPKEDVKQETFVRHEAETKGEFDDEIPF